jgi:hypothetical protein
MLPTDKVAQCKAAPKTPVIWMTRPGPAIQQNLRILSALLLMDDAFGE